MGRVHDEGDYQQLLAHAQRYAPRRGAAPKVLIHVRRLLVLGVETAHRTGGRDGIRNARELTNVGALLARYLPEVACATAVDLGGVNIDIARLFDREVTWWWLGAVPHTGEAIRKKSSQLAAVRRWLSVQVNYDKCSCDFYCGVGTATPPVRRGSAHGSEGTRPLDSEQVSVVFQWVPTVPSPLRARTVCAMVALAFGAGLAMRHIARLRGEDICHDGSYVTVAGTVLKTRAEVREAQALLSLVDGRVVKTNNPLTGLDKPSSLSLTPSILQATWATAQLAEGATVEDVCQRVPRATVLRCLDSARTFTLPEGLTLGMSHKALATIPSRPVLERSQAAMPSTQEPVSRQGMYLVSSQNTPRPSNTSRPHLRLIAGGKS